MNQTVQDKMQALANEYAAKLPQKINELENKWLQTKTNLNSKDISEMIYFSHTLCGTAGTFGYHGVSNTARKIEQILREYQNHLSQKQVTEIDDLMKELKQLVMELPEQHIDSNFDITIPIISVEKKIYILDEDSSFNSNDFNINFQIKIFNSVEKLLQAVQDSHPDMLILNIKLAKEIPLITLQQFHHDFISIIYVAEKDDLNTRLFSIRHGGQAFIAKPFDTAHLIQIMDSLFEARQMQHEHILIVDDSEALADYYATIIKHAGMLAQTVTEAKNFLTMLQEFQPDLILMDINMPFCSGIELAQIVKQQETLSAVPIIFLSTIAERTKQVEALSVAGDDFLTKPVPPKQLLSAIRIRLMRSRILRSQVMRDSLTNLYNHTMIHHQLERELTLAQRHNRILSVALIDIDHFKNINDLYGHQVGDKILKDLSSYLLANLRQTDLLGRYGGEEFLLIFPETSAEQALQILDKLRIGFAALPHMVEGKEVFVQLSGGIAEYPEYRIGKELVRAADEGLYQAKESGRNRITIK